MKNIYIFLILFLFGNTLMAQMEYISPPSLKHDLYTINIDNIVSKEDYCKLRFEIENTSDGYLAFDLSKVGFVYENIGTYYPAKGKTEIIAPGKKTVSVIKIDGKMDYRIEHFSLAINGLSHAPNVEATSAQQSKLEENTTAKIGNFEVTIKKAYPKRDMFYFTMTAEFTGNSNQLGTMMFPEIAIGSDAGKAMKVSLSPRKLELLKSGKKVNMSGEFESRDKNFTVEWGKTFKNYTLHPIQITPIGIHKIGSAVKPITPVDNNNNNNTSTCAAVRGTSQGQTKINFYNAEHKCFKVFVNGGLVSNDYSTNVTFNSNGGEKILEFRFEDGLVLKDNIFINRDWLEVAYRLKPDGNSYTLNLNVGSVIKDEPAPIVVDNGGNGGNNGNGGIDTRVTTTTNNNTSSGNESSQDETYSGRTKCSPENVTNGQFLAMKQEINSETSDGNKLSIAEQAIRGRCMTAAQVSDICRIFSKDSIKLEFAKYAFRYTYDIDNYYVVINTLSSDTEKKELRSYTRSN